MPWEVKLTASNRVMSCSSRKYTAWLSRSADVCAGPLPTARGLDVNCCALQHALKARRRLCIVTVGGDEVAELVIDIAQDFAPQPIEIDATSKQHGDRVLILG